MTRRVMRTLALLLALAVVKYGVEQAYAAAADTPPARLLAAWIKVFNSGEAAALSEFVRQHYSEEEKRGRSPQEVAAGELNFRDVVGGFELYKLESAGEREAKALLKETQELGGFARAHLVLDAARPEIIERFDISPAPAPPEAAPARVPPEKIAAELDPLLERMTQKERFSGAVLLAREGKPIFQKAYGWANREEKLHNQLDTRFRLGSMPKMFTSVAIAQLVQQGKLKYTDRVADLLPDYPNREAAKKITVHHLLTHTSGLGDIFGPDFQKKKDSLRELKDYVQLFAHQPLRFEPGTDWAYSNGGFIVAGLIVEKVSGMSYYDYLDRNIFGPAGMKRAGNTPKTERPADLAVGYTRRGERQGQPEPQPNWETLPWRGMSAGGGEATLDDLLKFDRALRSHKLLNAEMTEKVISGKVDTPGGGGRYAYGFGDSSVDGHRIVGHGGGAPGMNAILDMYWDKDYTVAVLSNLDPPAAQRVARYIRERLP